MRVRARYPRLAAVVLGFAGTMHNGIVTESFGYPELRGVSLSAYLHDKTGLPCMAARDMQVVAAGYAAQYTPAPKAAVCIYIGKLGAGAGIVLDGKVWGGAAGFAGELHYLPIKHNLEYAQNHFAGADMSTISPRSSAAVRRSSIRTGWCCTLTRVRQIRHCKSA